MNRQVLVLLAAIAALCLAPTTSIAARVPLTEESVIGGSSSNDGDWDYTGEDGLLNGKNITDGSLREDPAGVFLDFWLGASNATLFNHGKPRGLEEEYLVIDLGAAYSIDKIDLYNTHNRHWNSHWTDGFRIDASNSVVDNNDPTDFDLSGAVTTILTGVLLRTDGEDPVMTVSSFSMAPTASFRYLRFVATDTTAEFQVGLNEIEVFGSIIPEPSTLVLAALGLLGLMGIRRRRNR